MPLTDQDIAAIASVKAAGVVRGTAFLVGPKHAITARHVVEPIIGTIELEFPGHPSVTAKVVPGTSARLDWALLECTPPAGVVHMKLAFFDRWHENRWESYGFGGLYGAAGGPIDGRFFSESPSALGLHCPHVTTEAAAEGFSGAPLRTSSGVVGVIRFTRVTDDGGVKAGYFSAVTTRAIVADWPQGAGAAPTCQKLAPYVFALAGHLYNVLEHPILRRAVCYSLQIDTVPERDVAAQRVAERLVEEPWTTVSKLVSDLADHATEPFLDLVASMWVCRQAADKLATLLDGNAVTPGIRTKHYASVRHHVMRAEGEKHRETLITWRHQVFQANANSGEALTVVVAKALQAGLGVESEEIEEYLEHPSFTPIFVALNAIPTDAEVAEVRKTFGDHVKLIVHSANAANDVFAQKPLQAELVVPVPDPQAETAAKVLARKSRTQRSDR